jgi:hypothetical protein
MIFFSSSLLFIFQFVLSHAVELSVIHKPDDFDITRYQRFGSRETDETHVSHLTAKFVSSRHSQHGEDMLLYENFFYGYVNGTFIESGALVSIQQWV